MWNVIRESLAESRHRIQSGIIPETISEQEYSRQDSQHVSLLIVCKRECIVLCPAAVVKTLKTIEGFFFIYKDQPRELRVHKSSSRHFVGELDLRWLEIPEPWPTLP